MYVEGPRDTRCRQAEGNKRGRECLFQFSQHKPFSRAIGFPGGARGKESACQCRRCKRCGFDPWAGKISWRRKGQTTPGFLAWKIPWAEEPGGQQSMGLQRIGHDWARICYAMLQSKSATSRRLWNLEFTPQFPFRLSTCPLVLKIWTPVPLVWLWLFRKNKIIMKVIARREIFWGQVCCLNSHISSSLHILVVQSLSHVQLFVTPWTAICQASLSFIISRNFLKLISVELVILCRWYYTILSHPLLPPFLFVLSFSQLQSLFQWVTSSGGQSIGASASVYLLRHSFYVSNRRKIIFAQTHTRLKTMDIGQRVLYHPAFKEFM